MDAQGNPREWRGWNHGREAIHQHNLEEAEPTDKQRRAAITAARQAFLDTFGMSAYLEAVNVQDNVGDGESGPPGIASGLRAYADASEARKKELEAAGKW